VNSTLPIFVKTVNQTAECGIYDRFHCKVQVPMQWDVYKRLETERYPQGLDASYLYEDIE